MKNHIRNILGSTLVALSMSGCATFPANNENASGLKLVQGEGRTEKYVGTKEQVKKFAQKHFLTSYNIYDSNGSCLGVYAEGRGNGVHFYEASNLPELFDGNFNDGASKIVAKGWTDQKRED